MIYWKLFYRDYQLFVSLNKFFEMDLKSLDSSHIIHYQPFEDYLNQLEDEV
jgi:hypothetical protein